MKKSFLSIFLAVLLMFSITACSKREEHEMTKEITNLVQITMEDNSKVLIELYPEKAPITVKNFQDLVSKGFYNGLAFHRIVPGFVVQGGDPKGDGTGGPGYNIFGEFAENNYPENDLKHGKGAVAMARAMHPDSAGSQFYITVEAQPSLDGSYAVFGQVIEGMENVEKIVSDYEAAAKRGENYVPKMKSLDFVVETDATAE